MRNGLNVLIVEDNDIVRPITTEYLTELGHAATAAASAEEAMQALDRDVFDAILTDVRLPGMSGVELAKHCAEHFPALAIIVTSGYGDLSAQLFSAELRRRIFVLPKPFDLDSIHKLLNEVVARRDGGRIDGGRA